MIGYRSVVYNKNGESKITETIEERDEAYATGDWFDSPQAAQEALDKDIAKTKKALKEKEAAQKAAEDEAKRIAAEEEAKRLAAEKGANKPGAHK